jgi:hypothetical protein
MTLAPALGLVRTILGPMAPVDNYCKVTTRGVAHLFLDLDYGRVCACGRKVFAFAVEDEQPILRDRPRDETVSRLIARVRHQTPVTPRLVRPDLLLTLGETAIHRARRTREEVRATRVPRSLAWSEALRSRGTFLVRSARRVCVESALARSTRSGRRLFAPGAPLGLRQRGLPDPEAALMKA